jgi:DNA-binding response OmpR family regulator
MSGFEGKAANSGPYILVVCASEMVLYSLTSALTSAGYGVDSFRDAWRARKMVDSRRFALAIVDHRSDDEAGRELVRLLRRGQTRIKCLTLTAPDRANASPELQVDGIAVKPLPGGDLLETVAGLIGPPSGSPGPSGGGPEAA